MAIYGKETKDDRLKRPIHIYGSITSPGVFVDAITEVKDDGLTVRGASPKSLQE